MHRDSLLFRGWECCVRYVGKECLVWSHLEGLGIGCVSYWVANGQGDHSRSDSWSYNSIYQACSVCSFLHSKRFSLSSSLWGIFSDCQCLITGVLFWMLVVKMGVHHSLYSYVSSKTVTLIVISNQRALFCECIQSTCTRLCMYATGFLLSAFFHFCFVTFAYMYILLAFVTLLRLLSLLHVCFLVLGCHLVIRYIPELLV